jgi:hypothetical protein
VRDLGLSGDRRGGHEAILISDIPQHAAIPLGVGLYIVYVLARTPRRRRTTPHVARLLSGRKKRS